MKRFGIIVLTIIMMSSAFACKKSDKIQYYEPVSYESMNLVHNGVDGSQHNNFRQQYVDGEFFTDKNDNVTYTINAMYDIFTLANKWHDNNDDEGQQIVHRFGGNSPKYYEWMVQKSIWTDDAQLKAHCEERLVNFPIMASGKFWAWKGGPRWPVADGSFHYDDQFRYISAIRQFMTYEQSTRILSQVDKTSYTQPNNAYDNTPIPNEQKDVSLGKTVAQKLEMNINYILNDLNGKNGLIILPGENSGKKASKSSNYFDSYCYGHKSAYENQLFYHALNDLVVIEKIKAKEAKKNGDITNEQKALENASFYNELSQTTLHNFYDTFWDKEKQRFIATIDADNIMWDFGMTTQNLEAITYGACDNDKANSIMSWINGDRIIQGDTSTGSDIYYHKIAPRTNTIKIESSQVRENNMWKYWWHGMPAINPATNQKWNESQVNGGILFWTSYYDLMSRFKVLGAENAMNRLKVIASEYEKDLLFRDPANSTGNRWKLGVIDEFPESGLVPLAFLNGLLGINADCDSLNIAPNFPKAYSYAGIKRLVFANNTLYIKVYRDGKLEIKGQSPIKCMFTYVPMADREYTIQYLDKTNKEISNEKTILKDSAITIDAQNLDNCYSIIIQ